ncbi:hypothetical protein BGZ68_003195 [Mortierella alpina]|nr:hypothetical protein BGZ68_003195 [Mortierella alpina]
MVNIHQWDEFQKAAEELYSLSPSRTRYVAKYRHVEGKLVLKVTDDRTVRTRIGANADVGAWSAKLKV